MFAQVWSSGFFKRITLRDLDHTFYLGHEHTVCPSTKSKSQVILVIDVNGVHYINVQFCECSENAKWVEMYRQLLRVGWYPASFGKPKTAFTFGILNTYHKLTLQGKLNLYDFLLSILQKTDNCGRRKQIVCSAFLRIGLISLTLHGPSIGTIRCRDAFANGDT